MKRIWRKHKFNTSLKPKVFVAMSGGVDSSVAALLLKKQGYEVTGVYMKNWSEESFSGRLSRNCAWKNDLDDVKKVCKVLGIPFKVYNFEREYKRQVIDEFFKLEKNGLTPNPDILCNREIKFGTFLKKALSDGADLIATGHYARLSRKTRNKSKILNSLNMAKDSNKDQTYFLCLLNQQQLSKTLFPLGDLTKPQVRELAAKAGLPNAKKPESMGICFVGDVKFSEFLNLKIKNRKGPIKNMSGDVIGAHDGLPFYTIGQRKGLKIGGAGEPWFVVKKGMTNNVLWVAQGSGSKHLLKKTLTVKKWNWILPPWEAVIKCKIRIRHRQEPQAATIYLNKSRNNVIFASKQRAITPGQYCAVYSRNVLLGGGQIFE